MIVINVISDLSAFSFGFKLSISLMSASKNAYLRNN